MDNKQQKPKQKPFEGCLSFIGVCTVLALLLVFGSEMCGSKEAAKNPKYLFSSVGDFQTAFNDYTRQKRMALNLNIERINEGQVNNTFTCHIYDNVGIVGSLDKLNGGVKDIILLGSGGYDAAGPQILVGMAALIATCDATQDGHQAEIMKDLKMLRNDTDYLNLNGKTTRNGFKYAVASSKLTGLMFSIEKE